MSVHPVPQQMVFSTPPPLATSFPDIIPESLGSSNLELPGMSYIHPGILNILGTMGQIGAISKLKGHPNKH